MKINQLSEKQKQILDFIVEDENILICDGAVRSGKTIIMTYAFVMWAMEFFDSTNFAICGKTVSNAERNIIKPFMQVEQGAYVLSYKVSTRMLTVKCGKRENYFYLFGGKDESSYTLIQGLTLAGVLFDEVALMPKSFVEQAIARTLSYKNAKIWFNCNPGSRKHWFYVDWIINKERVYKHLHFLMSDNPILGEEEIEKADKLFSGVFHDRYIKGLWVNAEGLIYPLLADNTSRYIVKKSELPELHSFTIGEDFGKSTSGHAITLSAIGSNGHLYFLKSVFKESKGNLVEDIVDWSVETFEKYYEEYPYFFDVYADSAESSLINSIRAKSRFNVYPSIKHEIINRIRVMNRLLSMGKVHFVEGECDVLIEAFSEALWDEKSLIDKRLDDNSTNIDSIDSAEYSAFSYNLHFFEEI